MANYDVFNGDADGICALVQLRLADPRQAMLVTGVKRDIDLLSKIKPNHGDHITVLDISMKSNQEGLRSALNAGATVFYVDHHHAGDIPKHKNLFAVIDTRPKICTSLLVNKCLNGMYAQWAIVAAFGDNMGGSASTLANSLNLPSGSIVKLKTFGELLNYNGYGRDVDDLYYAPDRLYELLSRYPRPADCFADQPDIFNTLEAGFTEDMLRAEAATELSNNVFALDDAPWARRISGSFGNALARKYPDTAHAVLTHNAQGGYTVSVRAPLDVPKNADVLCLKFATGGGRSAAAGINNLPYKNLDRFIDAFQEMY